MAEKNEVKKVKRPKMLSPIYKFYLKKKIYYLDAYDGVSDLTFQIRKK